MIEGDEINNYLDAFLDGIPEDRQPLSKLAFRAGVLATLSVILVSEDHLEQARRMRQIIEWGKLQRVP